MIHSIKPSYAVKVVHSRVHLLIADIFSETSQNTVKTLQNHLWIVDTYIVDVVHNIYLFMQQMTSCLVFSGHETGFDAFFAKKKYWARKTFFWFIHYIDHIICRFLCPGHCSVVSSIQQETQFHQQHHNSFIHQ